MLKLDPAQVEESVQYMCAAAQIPLEDAADPRYKDQVTAFILALNKNYEREQTYDGLWRKYGLEDCANNAKSKAVRMHHHAHNMNGPFVADDPAEGHSEADHIKQIHDNAEDDALDLINYGAFCARLVHESEVEWSHEHNI